MAEVSVNRKINAIRYDDEACDDFRTVMLLAIHKIHARLLNDYSEWEDRDFDIVMTNYMYDEITDNHCFIFNYYDKGTDKLRGVANVII